MKIALAQTKSVKGNIPANIIAHQRFIDLAVKAGALAVFFPELSLTGYEPALANELALELNDSRLDPFDAISLKHNITIGFGAPIRTGTGVQIAMLFFQPGKPREIYSKQQLHSDEMPFFEAGSKNLVFELGDKKLVPAICYESLQNDNADMAKQLGAEIYLASVAKAQTGIERGNVHYPQIATRLSVPLLMVNCVGLCDNFLSVGGSGVWTRDGLVGRLGATEEGLLVFDTEREDLVQVDM